MGIKGWTRSAPNKTVTAQRVLFVDDEPALLGLLEMVFARLGGDWEVVFANGGQEALRMMDEKEFGLVVSDMRMPTMNGVELLTEVRSRHPQTARMILSGFADQSLVMRSLGVAHQFMSKPFDVKGIYNTVRRLVSLSDLLGNDRLRLVETKIQSLPSLPKLYADLMDELSSTEATTESVGDLISQDVSLTAKLLQLVNSAFFGIAQEVTSAREAVQLLGFGLVKTLSLSIYVFSRFDAGMMPGFPIERLWRHSFATGMRARQIAMRNRARMPVVETAFTAGILHDIGKLALSHSLPQLHRQAIERAVSSDMTSSEAEKEVIGASHAEVGAFLLGLWGLPADIVEAVAWHHEPRLHHQEGFNALSAVHVADYVVSQSTPIWDEARKVSFDEGYVRALGLEAELERCAVMAG